MERREDFWFWLIVASLFVAAAILMGSGMARAHEVMNASGQPTGWKYGFECCSALDCSQSSPADVSEVPEGYRINRTGEVVPYSDSRVKRSKDEYFHRCTHQANPDDPRSICLYVPDRGF